MGEVSAASQPSDGVVATVTISNSDSYNNIIIIIPFIRLSHVIETFVYL